MTIYEDMAPKLSEFVTEGAATNFAENFLEKPVVVYRTLPDLGASERSSLFEWLKWVNVSNRPGGLSDYTKWSLSQIAAKLNMEKSYLKALILERNAIIGEVNQYGEQSFEPHIPPLINNILAEPTYIIVDGYNVIDGYNLIITGDYFESEVGFGPTYVNFTRGETSINRGIVEIEADGGSVLNTQIVIKKESLPVTVQNNDEIIVYANGFTSNTYTLVV